MASRDILIGLNTSSSEQEYIALGVELGLRGDGRGRLDYRSIAVQADVLAQANGSSRVVISHNGTDVLAAVKVEVGVPDPATPAEGRIEVSVDCSNSLFPKFDERSSQDLNATLGRVLARVLRDSEGLDLSELSIIPGKFCWVVFADILVLQADGNIVDASSFATFVALNTARIPKITLIMGEGGVEDDFSVSPDIRDAVHIKGVERLPLCISMSKIGRHFVVDTSIEEESCVDARVIVSVDRAGRVCGLHKEGQGSLPAQSLGGMAQGAVAIADSIFQILDNVVKQAGTEPSKTQAFHAGFM